MMALSAGIRVPLVPRGGREKIEDDGVVKRTLEKKSFFLQVDELLTVQVNAK